MEQKTISGAEMAAKIERQIPEAKKEIEDFIDSLIEKYHVMSLANAIVQVADPYIMHRMALDEYQRHALVTAIYPEEQRIIYPTLGLTGEAGEVSDKVKKVLRDKEGEFSYETKEEIAKEIGDVLWYCATLANDLDYTLEEIAQMNIEKLASRQKRGKLHGNGDNR